MDAKDPRRSVYTKVKRNTRDLLLELFDAPENAAYSRTRSPRAIAPTMSRTSLREAAMSASIGAASS